MLVCRVLALEPGHVATLSNLANLLKKEPSGHEEATVLYRRALVVEPGHVATLCNLGGLLSKEPGGRDEAAVLTGGGWGAVRHGLGQGLRGRVRLRAGAGG